MATIHSRTCELFNTGKLNYSIGRFDNAITNFEESLILESESPQSHSNLLLSLNYRDDYSPERIFKIHCDFYQRFCQPLEKFFKPHSNNPDPERRIKIGYVSPDFRGHAVAFFIAPVLMQHNAERFEVFAYYNNRQVDGFTQNIQKLSHHWRNISDVSDEQVVEQIRKDKIDILVDLAGHSAFNRLLVFAYKPAPVQMTWLGYPNTTGLPTIDYRCTDNNADPEGTSESCYSEKIYRLPDTFLCYSPLRPCPETGQLPSINNGYITFGSLNNFSKVNKSVIKLWIKILKTVPHSKLVLIYNNPDKSLVDKAIANAKTSNEIPFASLRALSNLNHAKKAFIKAGLSTDRVMIRERSATDQLHLQLYQHIDIALDPFPYNGTTTTMESLWMGVPVITKQGNSHVSRVSSGILKNIGLTELIAGSDKEYINIAKHLAMNTDRLKTLRKTLRSIMSQSNLMNAKGFTKNLEAMYASIWKDWCEHNKV